MNINIEFYQIINKIKKKGFNNYLIVKNLQAINIILIYKSNLKIIKFNG